RRSGSVTVVERLAADLALAHGLERLRQRLVRSGGWGHRQRADGGRALGGTVLAPGRGRLRNRLLPGAALGAGQRSGLLQAVAEIDDRVRRLLRGTAFEDHARGGALAVHGLVGVVVD